MAKCLWMKCGKEFKPMQEHQKFCPGGKCRDAYNNWRKMTGIHLVPENYDYVKGIADSQGRAVDEQANIMIAKMANADGAGIDEDKLYGMQKEQPCTNQK